MSALVRLAIGDTRPSVAAACVEAFSGLPEVAVHQLRWAELVTLPHVNAGILPSWVAHDRHGGRPTPGVVQILPSAAVPPDWIVVTPPRRARLARAVDAAGAERAEIVAEEPLSPDDDVFDTFVRIFSALREAEHTATWNVAVDLALLSIPRMNVERELAALRRAYDAGALAPPEIA